MPSRQPSPAKETLATGTAPPALGRPPRTWGATLRLAVLPFVGLLLVVYLAGLALSLFEPQLIGLAPPSASLPDALGYPLSFATLTPPLWLDGTAAAALLAVYGLCVLGVRRSGPAAAIAAPAYAAAPAIPMVPAGSDPVLVGSSPIGPVLPIFPPAGDPPNPLPPSLGGKGQHGEGSAQGESAVSLGAVVESPSADDTVGARPVSPADLVDILSPHDSVGASGGRPPAVPASASPLAAEVSDSVAETFVPRVFISHSSANNAFGLELVRRIQQDLGTAGDAWYDKSGAPESDYESGLLGGDAWWPRIVREISERNVFVVLLSPEAMESHWVRDEIDLAWTQRNAKGPKRGKVIIPVLCSPCEIPETLGLVQVVSFLPGRPYEDALAELMAAIRLGDTRMVEQPTVESGPPFDLAQLPLPAHFVGREKELAFLRQRLTQRGSMSSIVAVNGLGGIGKTGLAAKVIRELREQGRFPDGIAVALCQGKTTEADALQILADVLTRFDALRRPPEADDSAGLAEAALRLLGGKETLVVLDNVEPELPVQLVVTPLREAGATLLLTARQKQPPDVVPPEGRLALDLLSEDEALDLLAKSLGRPAALDLTRGEPEAAQRIVENLGRHTLAVTLAAAYVADAVGVTLEQLAEQLADPQRALHLPKGEAPDEVKRVFASSYAALPDAAQRLFAALAAFPTPEFGREAAVALAESLDIADPERTVELLVRRALATAQGDRLRLHPLIQALAGSIFADEPEDEQAGVQAAVVAYYARYANANRNANAILAADEANIIGAIEWAQAHGEDRLLSDLCNGIADFWRSTGRTFTALRYLPEGIAAAQRIAVVTTQPEDQRRVARLQNFYSLTLLTAGRLDEAQRYLEESLRITQEVGDRAGEGTTLNNLSQVAQARGRLDEAQRYLEESLAISQEVG
ncbi:MAG TPA: NB-ARC domain-containing protein, partial [Ktedonobacterales bacterium]